MCLERKKKININFVKKKCSILLCQISCFRQIIEVEKQYIFSTAIHAFWTIKSVIGILVAFAIFRYILFGLSIVVSPCHLRYM